MSEVKKAAAETEQTVKKTAEKAAKTAQKAGQGKGEKILNWFKSLPKRISKPFKNMYYELKKVTWPSKHKLITYSIIVLVFMLFMGVVIGLLDMGASRLVTAISSLKNTDTAEEAVAEVAETVPEVAENAVVEETTQTAEQAQTEAGSN